VRAAVVTELNGPDGIEIREVEDPTPEPGQVRIDVKYTGISFPDVLQTRGGGCSVLRLLGAFQQLCPSFAESELPWTNIILSRVRIRSWVGRECG